MFFKLFFRYVCLNNVCSLCQPGEEKYFGFWMLSKELYILADYTLKTKIVGSTKYLILYCQINF